MQKSRAPVFAAVAIVAILAGFMAAQFSGSSKAVPTLSAGTLLPAARAIPEFNLQDSSGQPMTRANLEGHWSLVFFGYTSCPDICPTTLSLLAQVEKQLGDLSAAQRPRIVFVSVDPKRDTPAQVGNYIHFFSPTFIGVTGSPERLEQFTKSMGVPVAFHDTGNGSYTVDHAATLFLLDSKARVTAVFSQPHALDVLSADIRSVVTSS